MRQAYPNPQEDPRWAAIAARDGTRDGQFFYSVKTTGFYCRPSCAARPKPENVRIHKTAKDAEFAGFRPCKRCKPEREILRYALGTTSLGMTLVARSATGICAILFGESRAALLGDLRARFADTNLIESGSGLNEDVVRFIEARSDAVPALDTRGTDFQRRVWRELRHVLAGQTASYADIARRIDMPKASRAVAQACAANAIALAIPCHRVVRSDGGLSGYRWGTARKKALLAREAVA